jgi:vacuolar-type H+-ATPase subunit F/Vma7
VAIGHPAEIAGYALVGVDVVAAIGPEEVRRGWDDAVDDAALVLLTSDARAQLAARLDAPHVLWAVIPS